jgi:hypothetical protein
MLERRYEIFNDSKYTRWYWQIVNNARTQNRTKTDGSYYERHHIVPKSLGGGEANSNKVLLTFKEHFICHWLLTKMVNEKEHFWKMNSALTRMANVSPKSLVGRVLLSWQFVKAKRSYVDAMRGRVFSAETRAKMSTSATGRVLSAEHCAKMSASRIGKSHSAETRIKISASQIGRVHSVETRARMSASLTGRVITIEHRAKISASQIGKPPSNKGKSHSAETRVKISASLMKKTYYFHDPDNNHIVVTKLKEFCKEKNIEYKSMISLHNGTYKSKGKILTTYKGWRSANPAITGERIAA